KRSAWTCGRVDDTIWHGSGSRIGLCHRFREISSQHCRGGYQTRAGQALALPQGFVAAEKERLVFLDRTAHVTAVLIAFEGRPFVVEEVPRIQFIVAQEFEAASVDLMGPRFRDQIDGRSAVLAKGS